MGALVEHEGALRASLQSEYGVRLAAHDYGVLELADLVANLPPGCALWRATGGPLAWPDVSHLLARVEYGIRVLGWMKTEDGSKGRNQPKPIEPPPLAAEVAAEQAAMDAKAEAWKRRQERLTARASR